MSHAENAEYAEAFQTRSVWGADRWVYDRAGTVPRGEDFGVEWFRAVIFALSGVRKFDWVVGMKLPVTSLGFQETGSVNMVFAKTPNGNAPKRRTEILSIRMWGR